MVKIINFNFYYRRTFIDANSVQHDSTIRKMFTLFVPIYIGVHIGDKHFLLRILRESNLGWYLFVHFT